MSGPRLSVLDLVPIAEGEDSSQAFNRSARMAQEAESLGFYRYWLGEHHGTQGLASSSATLSICWIAGRTAQIRVGAAGILLQNTHALAVAEQFHMLEAMFPKRIDLGVGGGAGMHTAMANALAKTDFGPKPDAFNQRFETLMEVIGKHVVLPGTKATMDVTPPLTATPPIWMLAASSRGAARAGSLGLPMAYAYHLNPADTCAAIAAYREAHKKHRHRPYVAVSVKVVVGKNLAHADYLAKPYLLTFAQHLASGKLRPLPSPIDASTMNLTAHEEELADGRRRGSVIGDATHVQRELQALWRATGADELIILTVFHGLTDAVWSLGQIRELI
jgi:luciferase family oxidoreductase group 1